MSHDQTLTHHRRVSAIALHSFFFFMKIWLKSNCNRTSLKNDKITLDIHKSFAPTNYFNLKKLNQNVTAKTIFIQFSIHCFESMPMRTIFSPYWLKCYKLINFYHYFSLIFKTIRHLSKKEKVHTSVRSKNSSLMRTKTVTFKS